MTATSQDPRVRIAIAGASGFVGRALVSRLNRSHHVIALARQPDLELAIPGIEWRLCDLFNLRDAQHALAGADVAVYLVHSMMPSTPDHLTQGRFGDLDLICADNFARAAESNGVGHIVYLGRMPPAAVSPESRARHLESSLEVERTLGSRGVPVTTLRAGLIIGAGGSSFEMMSRLARRLPLILGPRWMRSLTQPIALEDVVTLLAFAIARPDLSGRSYDVGGPDVVSNADMLRMTGAAEGKRTHVLTLPIRALRLSLLWISAITGSSRALVRPLLESLSHDTVATEALLQEEAGLKALPLHDALEHAHRDEAAHAEAPESAPPPGKRPDRRVRSVQRMRVRSGTSALAVAEEYVEWLPRFMGPLLTVSVDEARTCRFFLWPLRKPLLVLTFATDRSWSDRQLFFVTGGLLAGDASTVRPRLEFRTVLAGVYVLAAIHDFVPRLPWAIYKYTQALVHLFVMRAFARHLANEVSP